MQIKLLSQKGKEIEEKVTLNKEVWGLSPNVDLVTQALYVFNSNKRRATASAKGRADVSGGGRKPWRQKGTGRARAGSIRSPLWVKGGVTFAHNQKNWSKRLNEKMKKKAIAVVLSQKLKEDETKFVKFNTKGEKKDFRKDIFSLSGNIKTLLISESEEVLKSVRNVKNFEIAKPKSLNIYEVLNNKMLLIDAEVIKVIEERLKNEK
jgi:large subunit ribosomal protein L4